MPKRYIVYRALQPHNAADVADYLLRQNMPPEEIKLDLNVVTVQTNDVATLKNLISFIPGWSVREETTYKPPKRSKAK